MTALRMSAADGLDIESTMHAEAMRRSADDDDSSDDVDDDSMRMAQMNTKPTLTARMIPILTTRPHGCLVTCVNWTEVVLYVMRA